MANFLRTVEFLCLSLWLGSDVFLSFVVAPGAFRVLASRDQAGAVVGYSLGWMHMIGVICGVLVAKMVSWISPLPSAVQWWSVLGGLLVALSVGLFFGTYPASKAAKLDPVEALRSE